MEDFTLEENLKIEENILDNNLLDNNLLSNNLSNIIIDINNKDIINIIDDINIEIYKTKKNKKTIKVSRERQNKINAASRRCRIKNKINFNTMKNHINTLHKLIKDSNINNTQINHEINIFKNTYIK